MPTFTVGIMVNRDVLLGYIVIIIVQAVCGKLLQVPQVLLELAMHIPQMRVLLVCTPVVHLPHLVLAGIAE